MDDEKAQALAEKIMSKAEDVLAGIEREMVIMKWPSEFRAIMWVAIAKVAFRREDAARREPELANGD